jgi:hypothetical protein
MIKYSLKERDQKRIFELLLANDLNKEFEFYNPKHSWSK